MQLRLDGAPDHRRVAEAVLELRLEPADRVEVLRRARVARRVGGEARQQARRQVGELSRLVEAARGGGLEPCNARELGLDRAGWPEVAGSIAGDDTVFIAAVDRRGAERVGRRLQTLGNLAAR